MKLGFKILLTISLLISGFFIFLQIRLAKIDEMNEEYKNLHREIKDVDVKRSKDAFFEKVNEINPKVSNKKYFYISFWATKCLSCDGDLNGFDTLMKPFRADMAYIFASSDKDRTVAKVIKWNNIKTKNFVYVNDVDSFINAIYKEQNIKYHHHRCGAAPSDVIMDRGGKVLYFDTLKAYLCTRHDSTMEVKYISKLLQAIRELK